jgi:hypothetical protein
MFHHKTALENLILGMYGSGKITSSSGRYKFEGKEFTLYFEATRLADVKRFDSDMNIKEICLHTWIGNWTSHTKTSHSFDIDYATLYTLLKLQS